MYLSSEEKRRNTQDETCVLSITHVTKLTESSDVGAALLANTANRLPVRLRRLNMKSPTTALDHLDTTSAAGTQRHWEHVTFELSTWITSPASV